MPGEVLEKILSYIDIPAEFLQRYYKNERKEITCH
jgi:transposase